ncbi:MAG: hypothetical protein MI750_16065 [Xanthomonadales bacterium]|nr:hypothetical protein [Xanthomonadales bacterium]
MRSAIISATITAAVLALGSNSVMARPFIEVTECESFLPGGPFGVFRFGTNAADTVFLNSGSIGSASTSNDLILGLNGNDRLFANDGNDCIDAGGGDDEAGGGRGNDVIFGRAGRDTIFGNDGNDFLVGGTGGDTIFGGNDADFIIGGVVPSRSSGRIAASSLHGGEGDDVIQVYAGNGDVVFGGKGNDTVVITLGQTGFSSENSRTIEIIDHEGNNQVQFENMFFNDLNFSRAEGKTNIYDAQSKVLIATISDQANSMYRFADTEVSAKEMESLTQ